MTESGRGAGSRAVSEAQFRRLVENAPDMLYLYRLSPTPAFGYVSPAVLQLTGLEPEAFYAAPDTLRKITYPEDRPCLDRALGGRLPAGVPVEMRLTRTDGQLVWTEHRVVPVYDAQGQVVAVEGIARNTTQRKRVLDEVRLLQATTLAISETEDGNEALIAVLREICQTTGWAFGQAWLPSSDGSMLTCGPAWSADEERVAPFRRGSLSLRFPPGHGMIGLAWERRRPVWVRDTVAASPDLFRRTDMARQVNFKAAMAIPVMARGEVVAVCEFFLNEAREEDERLVSLVSAVATQLGGAVLRKRMEEQLQSAVSFGRSMMAHLERRNQQLQALFQNMAEGVLAVDGAGLVLMLNPAAASLLGPPIPNEGQSLRESGLPQPLIEAVTAACQGIDHRLECRFTCGGGEVRALLTPICEGGEVVGAVALLQDVSVEDRVKRLRESFVANVSHDLRGPLAAISAGVEALHDGLISDTARPRYLRAILAEIARLRRLCDSLLDLSRIDTEVMQVAMEEFDLAPLAEGLLETWGPRANSEGIALSSQVGHIRVLANIDRVEEVLTNFLDNALHHTPHGGTIQLRARNEGQMVRVEVVDTGSGIDPALLPNIWERFNEINSSRSRTTYGGRGLGLSICKQLVEAMGGQVDVESEPGAGSTFSFTLVGAPSE